MQGDGVKFGKLRHALAISRASCGRRSNTVDKALEEPRGDGPRCQSSDAWEMNSKCMARDYWLSYS